MRYFHSRIVCVLVAAADGVEEFLLEEQHGGARRGADRWQSEGVPAGPILRERAGRSKGPNCPCKRPCATI